MHKSKYAVGSVSDVARKRYERLKRTEGTKDIPKQPVKVGTGRSHEAQSILDRQKAEKIREGNVTRGGKGK